MPLFENWHVMVLSKCTSLYVTSFGGLFTETSLLPRPWTVTPWAVANNMIRCLASETASVSTAWALIRLVVTEETTECTDEELYYMVNLNYPFCQEEEDLDAIIKNNLPVDTTNCTLPVLHILSICLKNNSLINISR